MTLAEGVLAGDSRAIARAISLIENEDPQAAALVRAIFGKTGRAYVVGVTGPPGAGKSTLVDRMTADIRGRGHSVGVLTVDPTSPFSERRRRGRADHRARSCRAITRRWISLVPSPMVSSFTSRKYFSAG